MRVALGLLGMPACGAQEAAACAHVHFAPTLARAAELAAALCLSGGVAALAASSAPAAAPPPSLPADGSLLGLFTGGTLCAEAQLVCRAAGGRALRGIDLGADEYTRGRPHPMIDASARGEALEALGDEVRTLLLDCVLGHGAHADAAGVLAAQLVALAARRRAAGALPVRVVASVTGTEEDPQRRSAAVAALRAAGVEVADTNAAAALAAATGAPPPPLAPDVPPPAAPPAELSQLLPGGVLAALSIGVRTLTAPLEAVGCCRHVEWSPPALGDVALGAKLARLLACPATRAANGEALRRMLGAAPLLAGVARAASVVPFLGDAAHPRSLLHAGPPVTWARMCGPQRGAVVGALLLEGWAPDADAAEALAASGGVRFAPCHAHGCVGPMAGVVSPSMALWVVRDAATGRTAHAPLNEGLGRAMRFGAFGPAVLERLTRLNGPVAAALDAALRAVAPDGLPLLPLMAKALHMGDELHNRCAAATSLLARALLPGLLRVGRGGGTDGAGDAALCDGALLAAEALRDNDHTFLNVSMAASKLACDAAAGVPGSTLCVAMTRNGTDFGVRLSGTGDAWFTAPAPYVDGLFFPQYTANDAGRDMGDSAITETAGLGGFSLAAAPAIAGFVGGTAASTLAASRAMYAVTAGEHGVFTLPSLDFRGAPVGIDACLVLDAGVRPVINTGIAHKLMGIGQIGAGVTAAPLECFAAALAALDEPDV
jgi:hypothetical protein